MRDVHSTIAGQQQAHHQCEDVRVDLGSGKRNTIPNRAPSRASEPQCELPLALAAVANPKRRTTAQRVAAFIGNTGLFAGDEQARTILEATARAEARRARSRSRGAK